VAGLTSSRVLAARAAGLPVAVLGAIGLAWLLVVLAEAGGAAGSLHHDALIHSALPTGVALVLFLAAWQAMVAAMMLPSSLPLIALFARVSANQPRPRVALAAFLGGYALVWTAFAALAFSADLAVHTAVDSFSWLEQRQWLIGGTVLALAGAFQFSALKDACLRECRHPAAYLMGRYGRGPGAAFRLGRGHGVFCLGCCWALMLLMFAAGVASLAWMAVLTAVMVYEKTAPGGRRAVPWIGTALLTLAALTFAQAPVAPM
jgi:predicted metal-binding membrane protein